VTGTVPPFRHRPEGPVPPSPKGRRSPSVLLGEDRLSKAKARNGRSLEWCERFPPSDPSPTGRRISCLLPTSDKRNCCLAITDHYDTNMKKIIFLLLLAAVGVVAYKYFTEEGY